MKYRNLVLIDDDEDDTEIFLLALKQIPAPTNCVTFDNASEALLKLEAKEVVPDLIFLDLNMPVMPGQQFLIEIKKKAELQTIPIIVFSTSSNTQTIELMKDLGAQDFITKPPSYNQLVALLKPLLT